ncbi:MAG: UvrD-helicase domain-containing protein [Pseudomonadota bacterium]
MSQVNSIVRPADADAREQALLPDRSMIVQAPAGSGKTGLLVYRLMTLLCHVKTPSEILAITFTRKATFEMRERVINLLTRAESGDKPKDGFDAQGLELAQAVLARDTEFNWGLLDAPEQLQIMTLDALCQRLTGAMPWLSRLGGIAQTTNQPDDLFAQAIQDYLIEALGSDQPDGDLLMVMTQLDFNYARAARLFQTMLGKRDQWLRHLLDFDDRVSRVQMQAHWLALKTDVSKQLEAELSESQLDQLNELLAFSIHNLAQSDPETGEGQQKDFWPMAAKLLLTAQNTWRKSISKTLGFPAGAKQEKDKLLALIAEFAESARILPLLVELQVLPSAEYGDDDWQQISALHRVLLSLAAHLQLVFRQRSQCDHNEVTQRAILALTEMESYPELVLQLDTQINHILVDEFQDTSVAQLTLLQRLTQGWSDTVEGSRTLFLVGDPMQSIYRFREADVGIFLAVWDNGRSQVFPNLDITALRLSQNFRSSPALVNWFNQRFSDSFPSHSNSLTGAVQYAAATSMAGTSATNQAVSLTLHESAAQEAVWLGAHIETVLAELPAGNTVAVLARTRAQLQPLLKELGRRQIAYAGLDLAPLLEAPAVLDILSLIRAICRGNDRTAWLALLRGPWVGLTLVQMQQISPASNVPVFTQLVAYLNSASSYLDSAAQTRLTRFIEVMSAAKQQHQSVSLMNLVRWTWQQLGGEYTRFGLSLASVETVFAEIDKHASAGSITSFTKFQAALASRYSQLDVGSFQEAKLVVSTMHKAKGLEFDVVILPALGNKSRADDKDLLMWAQWQAPESQTANLLLAPFKLGHDSGEHYEYLRFLERVRAQHEQSRLFYVAATRAKAQLILSASHPGMAKERVKKPPATSLLSEIWSHYESDYGESQAELPIVRADELEAGTERAMHLYRLPHPPRINDATDINWRPTSLLFATQSNQAEEEQATLEFEWAGDVAKAVGIVLHRWLQHTDYAQLISLPAELDANSVELLSWRAQLKDQALDEKQRALALRRIIRAVQTMKADPQAEFVLGKRADEGNELALASAQGNGLQFVRLDRTFIDDENRRWIIDYKTTDTQRKDVEAFVAEQIHDRHQAQLERYAALMSEIDDREIQLGVYFPLLKVLKTWPYQPIAS